MGSGLESETTLELKQSFLLGEICHGYCIFVPSQLWYHFASKRITIHPKHPGVDGEAKTPTLYTVAIHEIELHYSYIVERDCPVLWTAGEVILSQPFAVLSTSKLRSNNRMEIYDSTLFTSLRILLDVSSLGDIMMHPGYGHPLFSHSLNGSLLLNMTGTRPPPPWRRQAAGGGSVDEAALS